MPLAFEVYLVYVGCDAQQLAIGIEACCSLVALDVSFGEQHEHTLLWLNQCGESPAQVVTLVGFYHASHASDRFYLACGAHGVESLVAVGPLQHPAPGAFGNHVGCLLLGQLTFQSAQFIAEGCTVVIQAQYQLQVAAQLGHILVGLVGAGRFFACQHLIVGCDFANGLKFQPIAFDALVAQYGDIQYLLLLIVHDDALAAVGNSQFAIRRYGLLSRQTERPQADGKYNQKLLHGNYKCFLI